MSQAFRRHAAAVAAALALPCLAEPLPSPTLSRLQVDRTFGVRGFAQTALKGPREFLEVACDSHGRVVVGGVTVRKRRRTETRIVRVLRFLSDGSLDRTFGKRGVSGVALEGELHELLVDGEDRILLVGALAGAAGPEIGVVRLAVDGSADTTFSGDGAVEIEESLRGSGAWVAACVDPADDSVAAVAVSGLREHSLLRLDASGTPVATFGDGGSVALGDHPRSVAGIAFDGSGGIVIGYDGTCTRFLADGSPDTSLGGDGALRRSDGIPVGGRVERDAQGRIVVLDQNSGFGQSVDCHRFLAGGAPDTSFSEDGSATVLSGMPADGRSQAVFAVSRGAADRWVVAGRAIYTKPNSSRTGHGNFVQSIDPSAPDAVASLVTRVPAPPNFPPARAPDGAVDAAVSPDGATVYVVGERKRRHGPGHQPQLLRVDLTPQELVPLPDVEVAWVGRPSAGVVGQDVELRSRIRVTNHGAGKCLRGLLTVFHSTDAVLDPDDRTLLHDLEFDGIPPGGSIEFPVNLEPFGLADDLVPESRLAARVVTPFDTDATNDVAVSQRLD